MKKSKRKTHLTPNEVAELLMVNPVTVRQWAARGLLRSLTTPGGHRRFLLCDVEEFARGRGTALDARRSGRPERVLIVDDDTQLGSYVAEVLKSRNPAMQIEVARDGFEAGAKVESFRPHALLLDLMMPGMDGWRAISEFGRKRPELPIIVLSSSEDPRDARKALALGALGYVPKSASQHVLLSAIRIVMNGDLYVPPLVLNEPADALDRHGRRSEAGGALLTARQVEILAMLGKGQPNKTIASTLDLSEKTVKAHISAIFRALNVVNRTQAAAVGRDSGLI
jgi:two-component system, NarL family, nitrate/nitrite response regulator NarL